MNEVLFSSLLLTSRAEARKISKLCWGGGGGTETKKAVQLVGQNNKAKARNMLLVEEVRGNISPTRWWTWVLEFWRCEHAIVGNATWVEANCNCGWLSTFEISVAEGFYDMLINGSQEWLLIHSDSFRNNLQSSSRGNSKCGVWIVIMESHSVMR